VLHVYLVIMSKALYGDTWVGQSMYMKHIHSDRCTHAVFLRLAGWSVHLETFSIQFEHLEVDKTTITADDARAQDPFPIQQRMALPQCPNKPSPLLSPPSHQSSLPPVSTSLTPRPNPPSNNSPHPNDVCSLPPSAKTTGSPLSTPNSPPT